MIIFAFGRAYTGEVDESDPQRRLALPDPILCSGNTPSGFIGYAVNMINLDVHRLRFKTRSGNGLRETLFYRLFGELQVYGTRQHMIEARASIKHGAVSLDGGILRENGIISLGYGYVSYSPIPMHAILYIIAYAKF